MKQSLADRTTLDTLHHLNLHTGHGSILEILNIKNIFLQNTNSPPTGATLHHGLVIVILLITASTQRTEASLGPSLTTAGAELAPVDQGHRGSISASWTRATRAAPPRARVSLIVPQTERETRVVIHVATTCTPVARVPPPPAHPTPDTRVTEPRVNFRW